MTTLELRRFLAKVQLDDGQRCWMWMGAKNGKGYGNFGRSGRTHVAHRVSYEYFVGRIPQGLHLDHLCRTPSCVNPWHLEPVTCRENLLRGDTVTARHAAATHCRQGHPFSGENLYVDPKTGDRHCKECRRAVKRRAYWAKLMDGVG